MPERVIELTGQVLNLPTHRTLVRCPACGTTGETDIRFEPYYIPDYFFFCCTPVCLQMVFFAAYYTITRRGEGISEEEVQELVEKKVRTYNHYCKECDCFLGEGKK